MTIVSNLEMVRTKEDCEVRITQTFRQVFLKQTLKLSGEANLPCLRDDPRGPGLFFFFKPALRSRAPVCFLLHLCVESVNHQTFNFRIACWNQ